MQAHRPSKRGHLPQRSLTDPCANLIKLCMATTGKAFLVMGGLCMALVTAGMLVSMGYCVYMVRKTTQRIEAVADRVEGLAGDVAKSAAKLKDITAQGVARGAVRGMGSMVKGAKEGWNQAWDRNTTGTRPEEPPAEEPSS